MAIQNTAIAPPRNITLSNLDRLQIQYVANTAPNFNQVIAFMRALAYDHLLSAEDRTTWIELQREARTSIVDAFNARDGVALGFYLCFLSVVNARIAEDAAFWDNLNRQGY